MGVYKKIVAIILAAALVFFGALPGTGLRTAYAATTGTGDGTYDFGGLGGNDSAGAGFMVLGDKFKIQNDFTQWNSAVGGAMTQIYPNDSEAINNSTVNYKVVLKAEGGSTCKAFTFKDMGFSAVSSGYYLHDVNIVFKDASGTVISSDNLGSSGMEMDNTSIKQLSAMFGRDQWSVPWVSAIEFTFTLYDSGGSRQPALSGFENITVANVSSTLNARPVASGLQITGTTTLGQMLTGSYTYSDAENNPQGTSTFQWYRSDNAAGAGKTPIASATAQTYTIAAADLGKYLSFAVTPIATAGLSPGAVVESSRLLIPRPTVSVGFDAEGGSVSPASQTKLYGSTYGMASDGTTVQTLPTPAWPGHHFEGWWTGDDGTGAEVTDSTEVETSATHTLHAKWSLIDYFVTYDANTGDLGTAPADSTTYHYNDEVTVLDSGTLGKTGYSFDGWNTEAGGGGTDRAAAGKFNITDQVTLFAQWKGQHLYGEF